MPAGQTFGVVNASSRIVLMIDEAHRTQSSDLGDNLFEAFPNATRIAFTGTPLITERHGEKRTHKRFGELIDVYRSWIRCTTGRRCRSCTKAARPTPR
jgi:type I restriction enzyme R subunit